MSPRVLTTLVKRSYGALQLQLFAVAEAVELVRGVDRLADVGKEQPQLLGDVRYDLRAGDEEEPGSGRSTCCGRF